MTNFFQSDRTITIGFAQQTDQGAKFSLHELSRETPQSITLRTRIGAVTVTFEPAPAQPNRISRATSAQRVFRFSSPTPEPEPQPSAISTIHPTDCEAAVSSQTHTSATVRAILSSCSVPRPNQPPAQLDTNNTERSAASKQRPLGPVKIRAKRTRQQLWKSATTRPVVEIEETKEEDKDEARFD